MDLGRKGKVVIVTGGSRGSGLACARAFMAEADPKYFITGGIVPMDGGSSPVL